MTTEQLVTNQESTSYTNDPLDLQGLFDFIYPMPVTWNKDSQVITIDGVASGLYFKGYEFQSNGNCLVHLGYTKTKKNGDVKENTVSQTFFYVDINDDGKRNALKANFSKLITIVNTFRDVDVDFKSTIIEFNSFKELIDKMMGLITNPRNSAFAVIELRASNNGDRAFAQITSNFNAIGKTKESVSKAFENIPKEVQLSIDVETPEEQAPKPLEDEVPF